MIGSDFRESGYRLQQSRYERVKAHLTYLENKKIICNPNIWSAI
jgi:hypothetical protein